MSELTRNEYYAEIKSLADSIASEAMTDNNNDRSAAEEDINDSRLHETIDGHQWVIYNAYNLDVIRNSDNEDYYVDNFGEDDAAHVLKDGGISKLHTVMAFWCMYADVSELISDNLDALEEAAEEAEEADDTEEAES